MKFPLLTAACCAGFLMPGAAVLAAETPSAGPRGSSNVEWIVTPRPSVRQATPAGMAVPPTVEPEAASEWSVLLSDRTLYQVLLRWTREAGWQLVWEAERDFAIDAQVALQGSFLQALGQAMATLSDSDFPLQATANTATRVVRITRYQLDGDRR
ncbi:toxin co-regulated pilus biosynthesis Q family protein [Comamonadaceae bacterium PP-2]